MKEAKNKINKNDDIKKLKDLSEILTKYNLTAVEILENEKKYRVEKNLESAKNVENENSTSLDLNSQNNYSLENLESITSTMVGVFHDSPCEDQPPLITIGQNFKAGDVLCVIETMKTYTEVIADVSGTIKEICVKNGDLVEYSQPLFKYIKQ